MAAEHYIELRNFATGARQAILTGMTGSGSDARRGFLRLSSRQQVNTPGLLQVDLPGDYPDLALLLADKTLVIDWRRDKARGIAWYREFVGVARDVAYTSRGGRRGWTLMCPGLMSILSWYHVLWPAGTANRTTFTGAKAETIIKTLATYNAVAASATAAAGRDRNAPSYGIAVEADAAGGTTIDWTANRTHTLLEEIQAIARVAGGDISVVYTSATTRELRFHTGQLGTDRSATVTFAERLGNMDNIKFTRKRSGERTAALVAGIGHESARSTTVRTGTNYSAGNDIEVYVDAKDLGASDSTATRSARGDQRLDELEARDEFSFDVVQTDGMRYREKYVLGDLVSAVKPDGTTVTQQVFGIDQDYRPGELEQIGVEVRTR